MRPSAFLKNQVLRRLTSQQRLRRRRARFEQQREQRNAPHIIEYFHEPGDPYSTLMTQLLPQFAARYRIQIRPWLVAPPPDWAAPERRQLMDYSRRDAVLLANRLGLSFSDPGRQPDRDQLATAGTALLPMLADGSFVEQAQHIEAGLWRGEHQGTATGAGKTLAEAQRAGSKRREQLGHYLGATLHYGGEWYWGPDRLHYLESRLRSLDTLVDHRSGTEPTLLFDPPAVPSGSGAIRTTSAELEFFLSFRSPYSYLATQRAKALADAYQLPLRIRFVLPMVMRSLPVPRKKGFYIMQDAAREARRLGIPFGRIADPIGKPVRRGYAILPWAIEQGRGYAFAESFMRGAWAEGVDAGGDRGLKQITERAGLSWAEARALIGSNHWESEAEANRQHLSALGIWGVPAFRFGATSVWGQDRLWALEAALVADTGSPAEVAG